MEKRTIRVVKLLEAVGKNKNKELDETIIQTCKWIQKKLQISDKSIRDEKVPEMMSALAELVSARNERGERSCIRVE